LRAVSKLQFVPQKREYMASGGGATELYVTWTKAYAHKKIEFRIIIGIEDIEELKTGQ
jgi:hypothetical protein